MTVILVRAISVAATGQSPEFALSTFIALTPPPQSLLQVPRLR